MKLLQYTQIVTPFIAAIVSLSILGLSADIVISTKAYFAHHIAAKANDIIYGEANRRNGMNYLPRDMPYTRSTVLAFVGAIGTVLNLLVIAMLVRCRQGKKMEAAARTVRLSNGQISLQFCKS